MTHTPDIARIWRAGFVRRWHANHDLCHTVDPVDGHEARVAKLVMALWPDDVDIETIWLALTHDDGEHVTGDIPYTFQKPEELLLAEENAISEMWGEYQYCGLAIDRVKFCDRLDAYLWAHKYAPHVLAEPDWIAARGRIEADAKRHEVWDRLIAAFPCLLDADAFIADLYE